LPCCWLCGLRAESRHGRTRKVAPSGVRPPRRKGLAQRTAALQYPATRRLVAGGSAGRARRGRWPRRNLCPPGPSLRNSRTRVNLLKIATISEPDWRKALRRSTPVPGGPHRFPSLPLVWNRFRCYRPSRNTRWIERITQHLRRDQWESGFEDPVAAFLKHTHRPVL